MSKRTVYTDEPIKIGRRVSREILPGHGGPRAGAGRPPTGNKPVTLRLPPKLVAAVRRDAKRARQTMSEFVEVRLRRG
ncbi:MAG: ribbon-helix-helix protein, CopG family [Candidatus Rokubacteria bacterium]|nr:ribbon-helix-helix protein, CopG family [Candidatus Rokubacteria bacterium]